ncbi:hypothetical protein HK104_010816 [Borealophlyctis nickersoniae]|nr:hypothetical protein HK104_010816 [Borealophlyctis nickersoniae]
MRITPTLLLLSVAASTTTALPRGFVAGGRDPFWQADAVLDSPAAGSPSSPLSPNTADFHVAQVGPLDKRADSGVAKKAPDMMTPMRGWCPFGRLCLLGNNKRQGAVAPADVPSPLEKRFGPITTTTIPSSATTTQLAQPSRGWCPIPYLCYKKRQEPSADVEPSAEVLAVLEGPAPEESAVPESEVAGWVPQKRDEQAQPERPEHYHHGRPGFRRHKRAGGKQA